MDGQDAVRLVDVHKTYGRGTAAVSALAGIDLTIARGAFTAVMGPSGSGKSTLLQCAAGLDRPSRGQVFIDGAEVTGHSEGALTTFRRDRVGFVFQQFNLLPMLTVLQNVLLPLRLAHQRVDRRHCVGLLRRVGLGDRLDHRPAELSGGQQQRVAIVRALAAGPKVLFADEPTGALDTTSAREILTLLRAVAAQGRTVVLVTHDPMAAASTDEVVFLRDGRIVDRVDAPTAAGVADRMTRLGSAAA
ncbi:MAG TPA: ABC transporter ATP-binding protein [Pseudonocardiaceae bacterium]|nr:ABC transporter ATP-binding protein [Pseudonocardiaceae bacterium]